MPPGKTHDQIAIISLLPTLLIGYYVFKDAGLALTLTLTTMIAALMLSPDLDTKSANYYRWGILRFMWIPYRKIVSHRSKLSHSFIIGPLIKIIYLLIIILVCSSCISYWFDPSLSIQEHSKAVLQTIFDNGMLYTIAFGAGMFWANAQHLLADYFVSFYNRVLPRI